MPELAEYASRTFSVITIFALSLFPAAVWMPLLQGERKECNLVNETEGYTVIPGRKKKKNKKKKRRRGHEMHVQQWQNAKADY